MSTTLGATSGYSYAHTSVGCRTERRSHLPDTFETSEDLHVAADRGLHRDRPPDELRREVLRLARRRTARQAVGLLPRRGPGHPAWRLRRQHLLRTRPAGPAAGPRRLGR